MNIKIICIFSLIVVHSSSMPISPLETDLPVIVPKVIITNEFVSETTRKTAIRDDAANDAPKAKVNPTATKLYVKNELENPITRNALRPGIMVNSYAIEIEPNVEARTFAGRAIIQVRVTDPNTKDDDIVFHQRQLSISSVQFSLAGGGSNYFNANFNVNNDDGTLEINTDQTAELYNFLIEYTGSMDTVGMGLFRGDYDDYNQNYLAMNLHPTYARYVFPCIDEPSEETTITFSLKGLQYSNVVANSLMDDNVQGQFTGMQSSPHLWGLVAHNFNNIALPATGIYVYGRLMQNQESQAAVAINFYFSTLNEWTNKPYFEIEKNQDGRMVIFALPDTDIAWHALSTICIWEPYVLMEPLHSMAQRATGLVKIAEAMARQWFGFVLSPENWRHQWVLSGLTSYAAYDVFQKFQSSNNAATLSSLLDVNTLFVTDIIQESLLYDSYETAPVLMPTDDIFDESEARNRTRGFIDLKAPAIMRMLRLALGGKDDDFVQLAATSLLNSRALTTVNTQSFYDALNSYWLFNSNGLVEDVVEFLEPYVVNRGYPYLNVISMTSGGVVVTQEHFGFSKTSSLKFDIPITYTTSVAPDFSDDKIYPSSILRDSMTIYNILPEEEDWILFNIQGQGYYRVNYDGVLWQRIIDALNDPDERQKIHPLNRATLIDDSLNLARAGILDYDIALQVVLAMEHETEYAVWKAFVRNMDFLRKRLDAYVNDDDDLDQDIYLRMVNRAIVTFEKEITFNPDPMVVEPTMISKMRGIVMDHACRSGYQPCIAAAVDWFYDPNDNQKINPDIPRDIRPAVYCTMVREGNSDVIQTLYDQLAIEPSEYERVVILESLACSQDSSFINAYLEETIAQNNRYNTEERCRIFKAVAASSYVNANNAKNFLIKRTNEVRKTYGGPGKLDEMILSLLENTADGDITGDLLTWVSSLNSNLDDSLEVARTVVEMAQENLLWDTNHLSYVYDWIQENDAPTLMTSMVLICLSLFVALFNH